jgi:hypothetical protein
MQQACGGLGWTPDAFWGATLFEVTAAVVGFMERRGAKPKGANAEMYDRLYEMARAAQREERRAERERNR